MTIFLCGFMGCGKTTVGEILAKQLGLPLIDTDAYIVEQRAGAFRKFLLKRANRISGRWRLRRSAPCAPKTP